MWTPCTPILDEPVMVFLWEFRDFQLILVAPYVLYWPLGPFLAFGGAVAMAVLTYLVKRGQPAGALWHLLHRWEFLALPGVLSPYPQRYGAW